MAIFDSLFDSVGRNSFLTLSILVFVAVALLLEGLYLLWKSYRGQHARQIRQRLQALARSRAQAHAPLLKQGKLSDIPLFERLLHRFEGSHGLRLYLEQSGLDWTVSRLVLSAATAAIIGYLLVTLVARQSMLSGAVASVVSGILPLLYVHDQRRRRLVKIQQQLPEAIDLLVRALRSGHAFSSGLQMIGEEMAAPIATEFRVVHEEINFGVSLQQALVNLSVRIPITDLRYFIVAVLIQRESGGNLTELLGNLSRLIRERQKLLMKVRVLSSEGRLSAWVLGVMPFGLAAVMNLVNPGFMALLWTDPIGITIIKYMLTLMFIGILILRKIAQIRV
jgi:tight adherence protein B